MPPIRLFSTSSFHLTLVYATWFCLSALLLFGYLYWVIIDYTGRQVDESIAAQLAVLQQDASPRGHESLATLIAKRSDPAAGREYAYLLQDDDGHRLAGTLPVMAPVTGWLDLPVPEEMGFGPEPGHDLRALGVRLDDGEYLLVARDTFSVDEVLDLMERTFGWGLAATLVLAFVGGAVVSAGFLRRLEAINATSREIIEGDLSRRIPVRGTHDDFDLLSANLNAMLDRIQALMENLRQVSNDIAHDLRTPLARLRQRLEGAQANARSLADYRAAVERAVAETDGVLQTFNALLRIAQIESGSRRAGFAPVDLTGTARTIVETYGPVAEDRGHRLVAELAAGVFVSGDRDLLTQMLANLVENALCHTPVGATVTLHLLPAGEGRGARLIVADDGPGIPEGERPLVFRRFHRLDASRGTPGSGLGLSLVAAVADLHHASVALQDNDPGLRVVIGFRPPNDPLQPGRPGGFS